MILTLLTVMLLVIPALLLRGLWAARHRSRAEWLPTLLLTAAELLAEFAYGDAQALGRPC